MIMGLLSDSTFGDNRSNVGVRQGYHAVVCLVHTKGQAQRMGPGLKYKENVPQRNKTTGKQHTVHTSVFSVGTSRGT
jgi:hypothetical protein